MEELDPRLPPIVSHGTIAKPGIRVLKPETVEDQEVMVIEPIPWIVTDLIAAGAITMLAGPSNVGKSFKVLHIANKVARGGLVDGLFDTIPGNVLWIDNENGPPITRRRSHVLDRGKRLPSTTGFKVFIDSQMGWRIDPEDFSFWYDAVEQFNPRLLVFDSLNTILPIGCDENDVTGVRSVLDGLSRFLKMNRNGSERTEPLAALIVHHARKEENADGSPKYRGSSGIKDAVDIMLMMQSIKFTDDQGVEQRRMKMFFEKNRLAEFDTRAVITSLKDHGTEGEADFWVEYVTHGYEADKEDKVEMYENDVLGVFLAGEEITVKTVLERLGEKAKGKETTRAALTALSDKLKVIAEVPDLSARTVFYRKV